MMLKAFRKLAARVLGIKPPQGNSAQFDMLQERFTRLKATYDAARTTDEFKNYWANADRLDADSANSREVRHTLISRSRYEVANNAFSDGIAQTITNDLIGNGPTLRMQSSSEGFNRMVELSWHLWSTAIDLRRKLWCMGHAKHVDGEGFGFIRRNPRVRHPIPLDVVLYEAEQIQTPYLSILDAGYIDGIRFDDFGNPLWYDLLREHPGAFGASLAIGETERVPADKVLHWFRLRRPGQHRGVPEMGSSLNAGAAGRRWREATLSAAERAALLTLMMETPMTPDEADAVAPFTTMDIEKGLMSFLPMGWKPNQLDGKFPTASHESFNKQLINEMGRSVNMPRNKAAADSSDYNYASGRLDHGTYYDSLDVQRVDCNSRVLTPLFNAWFDLAVARFGWLGGDPDAIGPVARLHLWDWPKHRVADVEAEANANQTCLQSGQKFLHTIFTDAGMDFEDELDKAAKSFGIPVDEMRTRLLDVLLPPVQQGGAPSQEPVVTEQAVAAALRTLHRRGLIPTNGHANGAHVNGN
jgi:capsid protein